MAATIAELQAKLGVDDSQFRRGLSSADRRFHGFGDSVSHHASRFLKAGVGAAVGVSAAFAGMAIYKGGQRAVAIDDANRKLEGLGYNAKQVARITDNALKSVLGTPYSLAEALNVASNAMAAGVKPGRELSKYLGTVADTAAIAGTSMDEIGPILNKATANVKVHADVLNQLADRGLPVFSWLQKEYDVSGEKLSEMVKSGKVDAETLLHVIRDNIGGASKKAGEGIRGSFSNLITAVARLGDAFVGPVFGSLPKFFTFLRDEVDKATEAVKPLGEAFGRFIDTYGPRIQSVLRTVVGGALQFVGGLIADVARAIRDNWGKITDAFKTVWKFIKENLLPIIRDLRTIAVRSFQRIAKVIDENRPAINRILDRLGALLKFVWTILKPILILVFEVILPRVLNAAIKIIDNVSGAIEKVIGWFRKAKDRAQDTFDRIRGFVSSVVDRVEDVIGKIRSMAQWFKNTVDNVKDLVGWIGKIHVPHFPGPGGVLGDGIVGAVAGGGPKSISSTLYDDLALANASGLVMTSGYRPGAITSTGNTSLHSVYPSKAIDVAGSEGAMRTFFLQEVARGAMTGLREVIHSPYWWHPGAGIQRIPASAGSVLRDHYSHVHVGSYDSGGFLRPGWNLAYNGLGRPERVGGGDINFYINADVVDRAALDRFANKLAPYLNRRVSGGF